MPVTQLLLNVLRCPESHGELTYIQHGGEEFLLCKESKLRYRIEDGIPVMLASEAELMGDAAFEALVGATLAVN